VVLGAGPPQDKPASPRSLPTDGLPPFGMLDDSGHLVPLPSAPLAPPPTGPAHAMAAAQSHPTPGLSLDLATEAVRAALDACAKQGFPIAAAVVDSAGQPRAMLMAEGSPGSVFVAMRKAATTLTFRVPSSEVGAKIQQDKAMLARMTPVMFISGGALPIWRGNELVGAIASSGAHGEGPIGRQDEICAQAGLDRIKDRLSAQHK
jgi:uncharacterized protein GlcG (DUF336 family)